jgi:hypothetical protein
MKRFYNLYNKFTQHVIGTIIGLLVYTSVSNSMEISQCNKMWGVTQDANGEMLYKVAMYMCIEDPYNIYKNTYLKSSNTITSSTVLPNQTNVTTTSVPIITTTPLPNQTVNKTFNNSYVSSTTTISPLLENENQFIDGKTNTSRKNITNATNLRTSQVTKPNHQVNTEDDSVKIILIISGIVLAHIALVGVVYYKKRKRKVQDNKIQKSLQPLPPVRKPQLKPFANDVHPHPNKHQQVSNTHHKKENVTNKPFYNTRKKPLSVNINQHKTSNTNTNANTLTPNTKQIFDESQRSVKKWYKKTFPSELRQSSNENPLPPSYAMKPSLPDENGNVKLMVDQKERDIRRNNPTHPSNFAY